MSNNFLSNISPSVRIIILFLLALNLFFANSIYLILFITTLTLILVIITDKKVNIYVKGLKKVVLLLLIFLVTYIIMFRQYDIYSIVSFTYRLVVVSVLVEVFLFNINLKQLHEGLYGVFLPLKKYINIEKLSLNITLSLYFIKYFMESREQIRNAQIINAKRVLNVKKYILSCLIYSINQLDILQESLKIKFYKLNYKKTNIKSKLLFLLFFILFIVSMFKEVML